MKYTDEDVRALVEAIKGVQESIAMNLDYLPKGSLQRGQFEGFFLGVSDSLTNALKPFQEKP